MKKLNKISRVLGVVLAGCLTACSSDYLDLTPESDVAQDVITSTVDGAEYGLNGLCRSMYVQYSGSTTENWHCFNGESWIANVYGEVVASDDFEWLWAGRASTNLLNWNRMTQDDYPACFMAWMYCYNLINQANVILSGIDTAEGSEGRRAMIKAQTLTIRAHAYTRLLQIYGPRWIDSREGEVKCVVLRKVPGTGDMPLSSMKEVLDCIYDDLNTAIDLYAKASAAGVSTGRSSSLLWLPDVAVARGIYARAALLKNDYKTAQTMAHDARADYPIMTADEYKAGFAQPNSEWMWCNSSETSGMFYWAYGAWNACNGPYPAIWGYGAGAINYDLYRKIPSGDIRADLFLTPDKTTKGTTTDKDGNEVTVNFKMDESNFWNSKYITSSNMNCNGLNTSMQNWVAAICTAMKAGKPASWNPAYFSPESQSRTGVTVPFGAQFKFWGIDEYGSSCFPFMRGAEMLLIEAEAAYQNSDPGTAQNCLIELNKNRNANYSCNKTGDDLLAEIKLQRRIELWGEGFSWFDLKRWNEPMTRRPWVANQKTSNNIPSQFAVTIDPSFGNKWRYAIPQSEVDYNHAIDISGIYE